MSLNLQDPLLRLTGIHPRQTGGPLFCQILTDFARGGRRANSTPGPARVFFFDLEKAYDTTWKYGILKDVHDIGLKGRLPLFLQNFLTDREFKVKVGSTLSALHKQEQGVPHGSILSVTLFWFKN